MANDFFFSNEDRKIDYMQLPKILHLLSGMTVTLFDAQFHHLLSYPVDPCDFCRLIRANQDSYGLCRQSDWEAWQICVQKRGIYVYKCPMGLYEALLPLYRQEILSGFLMAGQVMEDSDENRERTKKLASGFISDGEQLEQAMQKLTYVSTEKLQAILQMLEVYGRYSSKTLTEAFRKAYHTTIVQYTNDVRLKQAKNMLTQNPDRSVQSVALACGFSDQGYFCKLYLKKFGMTPTETARAVKGMNR